MNDSADVMTTARPAGCTTEHLEYLDGLRESGITNMFGARPYLIEAFDLDERVAGKVLSYWMKSFGSADR